MKVMKSDSKGTVTIELPEVDACLLRDILEVAPEANLTCGEEALCERLGTFLASCVGRNPYK